MPLTQDQIQGYLSDPDTIPDDADVLAELAGAPGLEPQDGVSAADSIYGDTANAEGPDATPAVAEKPKEQPSADASPAPQEKTDDYDPAKTVIKTRDGKHEMPFSVLQSEREKARTERERADALAQQLEQERGQRLTLQQQIEAANKGGEIDKSVQVNANEATNPSAEFNEAEFRENYGDTLTEIVLAQRRETAELRGELNKQRAREQEAEQAAQRTEADTVQEAIDNNPTLSTWRASDPAMWAAAIAVDNQLRESAEWQGKSYAERFNVVVEKLTGKPSAAGGDPRPDQNDIDRKAEEALRNAKQSAPHSISDIPGGREPAQSERESVADMSVAALGDRFEKMSPEQREAFLANL